MQNNVEEMRVKGKINDKLYGGLLIGFLLNPSVKSEPEEIMECMMEYKNLDFSNEIIDYGDGYNFTEYERILFYILNNPEIKLDDIYKASLITNSNDVTFTNACLNNVEMSNTCKLNVLNGILDKKYASREEYFQILNNLATNEHPYMDPDFLISRIINAKEYKAEEVNTETDDKFNALLTLASMNMKDINGRQKVNILTSSKDFSFIKEIVERNYKEYRINK